jgi:hypothetical protein
MFLEPALSGSGRNSHSPHRRAISAKHGRSSLFPARGLVVARAPAARKLRRVDIASPEGVILTPRS